MIELLILFQETFTIFKKFLYLPLRIIFQILFMA